jgi:hypothetical protein
LQHRNNSAHLRRVSHTEQHTVRRWQHPVHLFKIRGRHSHENERVFGYVVALMPSGRLMTVLQLERIPQGVGAKYQLLLGGAPFTGSGDRVWSNPFSFEFENDASW